MHTPDALPLLLETRNSVIRPQQEIEYHLVSNAVAFEAELAAVMRLSADLAEEAVRTRLADELGIDTVKAAAGIFDIMNENMIKAAKVHIAERGKDPRILTLVALGGAGPVHAGKVARGLGISKLLIPPRAGVASAVGVLVAPPAIDSVRGYVTGLVDADSEYLNGIYQAMETEASAGLEQAGVPNGDLRVERSADMRYVGQGYEVKVPFEVDMFRPASQSALEEAFYEAYEALFERRVTDVPIEVVSWRLLMSGPSPRLETQALVEGTVLAESSVKGTREVFFAETGDSCRRWSMTKKAFSRGTLLRDQR